MLKITIICPVHNESVVIPLFLNRLSPVVNGLSNKYLIDLIFINNASTDNTLELIQSYRKEYDFIYSINLSTNVGYQRSVESGLRNAKGNLFVVIDVDCEDPPEMIADFVQFYEKGFDIVYGERVDREEAKHLKRARKVFYRVTRALADEDIILDMAEFALITSEVRDAIVQDKNTFPFIRSSIGRVGFRRIGIPYKRQFRIAGKTHYNLFRMTKFAVAGILSSSTFFLRLPIYILPFWITTLGLLTYFQLESHKVWITQLIMFLFCVYIGSTISFMSIYLARVYKNTLGRPNYIICKNGTHLQPDVID